MEVGGWRVDVFVAVTYGVVYRNRNTVYDLSGKQQIKMLRSSRFLGGLFMMDCHGRLVLRDEIAFSRFSMMMDPMMSQQCDFSCHSPTKYRRMR